MLCVGHIQFSILKVCESLPPAPKVSDLDWITGEVLNLSRKKQETWVRVATGGPSPNHYSVATGGPSPKHYSVATGGPSPNHYSVATGGPSPNHYSVASEVHHQITTVWQLQVHHQITTVWGKWLQTWQFQ